MKRIPARRTLVLSTLALSLTVLPLAWNTAAAAGSDGNTIEAVLTMDVSSSMNGSDVNKVGNEAMKMFIDMSSVQGDKIGVVAYTDQIVRERAPLRLDNPQAKQDLKIFIDQLTRGPFTDIGVGIDESLKVLEASDSEPGRVPLIVVFTDGNNWLNTNRTQEQSDKLLQSALNRAKSKGVPVYTIGLNADGQLNRDVLNNISDQTKGKSFVTSSAADLPKILSEIYADHLKLKVVPLAGVTANGQFQDVTVNIPNSSVMEGNISLISGKGVQAKLFDPNGTEHPLPSAGALYSTSASYSLIKLIKPVQGDWKLQVKGVSKDRIDINLVYNYDMHLVADPLPAAPVKSGDAIPVKAKLMTSGQPVTDPELYKELKPTLLIKDLDANLTTEQPLTISQQSVEGVFQVPAAHDYELSVRVDGVNFVRQSPGQKLSAKPLAAAEAPTPAPAPVPPAKPTPWGLYAAIAGAVIAFAGLLLWVWALRKKAMRGFVGQLVMEVKDEDTGERGNPQYKRLSVFRGKFQLHQLLQLMPEFAETKDIWFSPGQSDRLVVRNAAACVIEKGGRVVDASGGIQLTAGDRVRIQLKQTNKSISIEYLR